MCEFCKQFARAVLTVIFVHLTLLFLPLNEVLNVFHTQTFEFSANREQDNANDKHC